jgi:arabinan endo-1,5-alpha-L-arabinosidase
MPGENVKEGTYQIRSQQTGSILQVPAGATNGSLAQTARYLIRDNQKWTITPGGGGYYKILGVAGEMALETAGKPRDGAVGGVAELASLTEADNQLWRIDQLSDGSYRIVSKVNQQAITATTKIKPGNGIALQPFSGDDTQRWVLTAP